MLKHLLAAFAGALLLVPFPARSQDYLSRSPEEQAELRRKLAEGIGSKVNVSSISSFSDAQRAVIGFNDYLQERTGHSLAPGTLLHLAQAEWDARTRNSGTIPVDRLVKLATRAFLESLEGPGTTVPTSLGTPFFVVTIERLNAARLFYRRHAPDTTASDLPESPGDLGRESLMPAVQNAFPLEAVIALYTCVSEDLGFGSTALREHMLKMRGDSFFPERPGQHPFGDDGWATRRPVSRMLTDQVVNEILNLGS